MDQFFIQNTSVPPTSAELRRRLIQRRTKVSDATADLIVSLAFPPHPDRDERHLPMAQMMTEGCS